MSKIDELKAKSEAAKKAADTIAAKKAQEKQDLINRIVNFFIEKISDSKLLDEIIDVNVSKPDIDRRSSIIPICMDADTYKPIGSTIYDINNAEFYIGAHKAGTATCTQIHDTILKISKEECKILNLNGDRAAYGEGSAEIDAILVQITKSLTNRLSFMGFTTSIGGPERCYSNSRDCWAKFAW